MDLGETGGVSDNTETVRSHVRVFPEHGTTLPAVLNSNVEASTHDRGSHESIVGIALPGGLADNELVEGNTGVLVDFEETGQGKLLPAFQISSSQVL